MKSIVKIIAFVLAVGMFAASALVACSSDKDSKSTTTTAAPSTTAAPGTTLAPAPAPTPGDDDAGDDEWDIMSLYEGVPAEAIVTGEEAEAYHNGHKTIKILDAYANFDPWSAENEDITKISDGWDGWLNTVNDEGETVAGTKFGGGGTIPVVAFKLETGKKLVGYTFVSGNDSSQFHGRHPNQWVLFSTGNIENEDWTDAIDVDQEQNWTVVDVVSDAGLTVDNIGDFTAYNYTIDADKQGEYEYLVFDFTGSEEGVFAGFQLCEVYFYYE